MLLCCIQITRLNDKFYMLSCLHYRAYGGALNLTPYANSSAFTFRHVSHLSREKCKAIRHISA